MAKNRKPGGYFHEQYEPRVRSRFAGMLVKILGACFTADESGRKTWERRVREYEAQTKYDVPDFM
eukprot:4196529-Amphidinium_carterae.1